MRDRGSSLFFRRASQTFHLTEGIAKWNIGFQLTIPFRSGINSGWRVDRSRNKYVRSRFPQLS